MQHAVFFFIQIFFVVLAVSVIGIVVFTIIKNKRRDRLDALDSIKKNNSDE